MPTARPTPSKAAGDRGQRRAASNAARTTIEPSKSGSHRVCPISPSARTSWPSGLAEESDGDGGRPNNVRTCSVTIMAPTPHENPETTACGTLTTYRPSRSTQKIIMKTEAARQTLAAPPIPWARTAAAMKGTVALAVPPIKTGLRPRADVMGAVTIDVNRPSSGGRPMRRASARP